jgi:hypothetical protein
VYAQTDQGSELREQSVVIRHPRTGRKAALCQSGLHRASGRHDPCRGRFAAGTTLPQARTSARASNSARHGDHGTTGRYGYALNDYHGQMHRITLSGEALAA